MIVAGLLLIFSGSIFHELIGLISMFNLAIVLLTSDLKVSDTCIQRTWQKRKILAIIGMIGLPLVSWALLCRSGYFMGKFFQLSKANMFGQQL
jgi:hypothetical protein